MLHELISIMLAGQQKLGTIPVRWESLNSVERAISEKPLFLDGSPLSLACCLLVYFSPLCFWVRIFWS